MSARILDIHEWRLRRAQEGMQIAELTTLTNTMLRLSLRYLETPQDEIAVSWDEWWQARRYQEAVERIKPTIREPDAALLLDGVVWAVPPEVEGVAG